LNVVEPAILVTEDTNVRVKADARRVPAISTTLLKLYLIPISEPTKRARDSTTVRIKSEYDETDTPMPDFPPHMDDTLDVKVKHEWTDTSMPDFPTHMDDTLDVKVKHE
jgi:hypothetical protein